MLHFFCSLYDGPVAFSTEYNIVICHLSFVNVMISIIQDTRCFLMLNYPLRSNIIFFKVFVGYQHGSGVIVYFNHLLKSYLLILTKIWVQFPCRTAHRI